MLGSGHRALHADPAVAVSKRYRSYRSMSTISFSACPGSVLAAERERWIPDGGYAETHSSRVGPSRKGLSSLTTRMSSGSQNDSLSIERKGVRALARWRLWRDARFW